MRPSPVLLTLVVATGLAVLPTAPARASGNPGGKAITTGKSDFGTMLFDAGRQAIYAFENDERGKSNCYGDCARAWPPVLTKNRPRAQGRVKASLLGTTRRRSGKLQVTYNGRPLYFYVNEGPGEVLCHNVNLNGGLWWVLGPNGKPRP